MDGPRNKHETNKYVFEVLSLFQFFLAMKVLGQDC